jgi:hypothetical protein
VLPVVLAGGEGHAGDIKGMVGSNDGRRGELDIEEDSAQEDIARVHIQEFG